MGKNIIYDPQVRINNETFSVVPNSIRMKTGKGESTLKPQSSGNGKTTMVYSEDVETKISGFTCSVYSTKEKIDSILNLKDNKFNNYVVLNEENVNYIFKDATLTNDPEITLGNDGQAELEFAGKPIE